jgi:hypothetical protein
VDRDVCMKILKEFELDQGDSADCKVTFPTQCTNALDLQRILRQNMLRRCSGWADAQRQRDVAEPISNQPKAKTWKSVQMGTSVETGTPKSHGVATLRDHDTDSQSCALDVQCCGNHNCRPESR